MTATIHLPLVALSSYLVGAIPFGWLVARARGVDILRVGSGNIGATNVARKVGLGWGILVFLLDFAKGAVPVLLAGQLAPPSDAELPPNTVAALAGVAAFIGHLFPVYLGFKGGKGVATGAGVVAVFVPLITLAVLATWGVVLAATRYVSLASLFAAALLFGLRLALTDAPWGYEHVVVTLFCLVGAALVFVRHRTNIRRLFAGSEHRLGSPEP